MDPPLHLPDVLTPVAQITDMVAATMAVMAEVAVTAVEAEPDVVLVDPGVVPKEVVSLNI